MSHWWSDTDRGELTYYDSTCPRDISFTTNPTWNGLGSNLEVRGEISTTLLSHNSNLTSSYIRHILPMSKLFHTETVDENVFCIVYHVPLTWTIKFLFFRKPSTFERRSAQNRVTLNRLNSFIQSKNNE
jgi:hypothetical protein